MNSILYSIISVTLVSLLSCKKADSDSLVSPDPNKPQKGIVQGRVTDSKGKPVAHAEIVASSTDWQNRTSTGYSDANGYYTFNLPNGIAEGSYSVSGTVTIDYQGKNYKMALYEEDTRVFSAYDGAVRNFIFRLTGKRTVDADKFSTPLGATLEVHHQVDRVVLENLEITLEPVGALVDGSTGTRLIKQMPEASYEIEDIPLGLYKISARDKKTGKQLGVTIKDSFKDYASSVTSLFQEDNFEGDTEYRLILLVDTL